MTNKPKIIRKKFSKQLYADSNDVACNAVKHYFKQQLGFTLISYADDVTNFKSDLIEINKSFFAEVERKLKFEDRWIWPTVHILERKAKMLLSSPTFLCIVNNDCSKICILSPDTLKEYINNRYLEEVSNNKVKCGEKMYNVPIENAVIDNIPKEVETFFFGIDKTNDADAIAKKLGLK